MESDSLNNTSSTQRLNSNIFDKVTSHIALWLFSVSILMIIGFLLLMSPEHFRDSSLVHLSPGHAITAQDIIALFPIAAALILLILGLRNYRDIWQSYVRQSPTKAILLMLCFGLAVGLFIGLPLGAVFAAKIRTIIIFIRSFIP